MVSRKIPRRWQKRSIALSVLAGAVLVISLAACGSSGSQTDNATSHSKVPATAVTLAMGANYGVGNLSPLYYGVQEGYWSSQGVNMSIKVGTGSATVVDQVSSGEFDFAFLDTSVAAGLIAKGAQVKVIAEMQNKSDIGVYCNSAYRITNAKELIGKTLSTSPGDSINYLIPAFAKNAGIQLSSVKVRDMGIPLKLSSVVDGQSDCATGYTSYAPTQVAYGSNQKIKATTVSFSNYGVDVVGYGLVGNDKFMQAHPQVTKAVVAGFIKAMYEGMLHPTASNAAGESANPTAPGPSFLAQLKAWVTIGLKPYWVKGEKLGENDPTAWKTTLTFLHSYQGVTNMNPASYYTNQYLPSDAPVLPLTIPY
jgi:NitT/TauT family transport system substrate-binding protein